MYLPKCQKLALIRKDDFFRNKKKQCLYKRGDHPDCSHTVDNDESDEEPTPLMSAQQGKKAALEDAFRYCEEQFEENIDASFMAKLIMLIQHAALKVQEEKKQLTLDTFLR